MVFEWCMALCTTLISYIYPIRTKKKKKGGEIQKQARGEEREQLSKGKLSRDKQRDQYTHTQAIEREIQ
jgi:hypothetical protein